MLCPRCQTELEKNTCGGKVFAFSCPNCNGQAITLSALRTLGVEEENTRNIWKAATKGKLGDNLPCPECKGNMRIVKVDDGKSVFYIDLCIKCHTVWFDFGELEKIPVRPPVIEEELPQRAKEILALHAIEKVKPVDPETTDYLRRRYGTLFASDGGDFPFWLSVALDALLLAFRIFR